GIEKLKLDRGQSGKDISYISKLNELTTQISDMIDFYEEIAVEESIISQIIKLILKIGDRFFQLDLNRDLYLTLFYIQNNFVLTKDYKFEIKEFSKHYKVKKLRIDFYVDKIMSNKFGFYMFTRGDDAFFFHEDDLLGKVTFTLIRDKLFEFIIRNNRDADFNFYQIDLDKIAEDIAEELIKMNLIWEKNIELGIQGIREPFEMLIEKLFVNSALDMGFNEEELYDLVLNSEKLLKSIEGRISLKNIIKGSDRYEDLNIVSLSEASLQSVEDLIDKVEGFCPNCGKTILKQDFYQNCPRCKISFKNRELEQSLENANKISIKFKQEVFEA
ncbi:MAG: hypothetical protein P8Y97_05300, partial [Candidatus Lokiarchaeota archaeon]